MDLKLDSTYIDKQWGDLRQLTVSFLLKLPNDTQRKRYTFVECKCGKVYRIRQHHLIIGQAKRCKQCALDKMYTSAHPNYKGGISKSPLYRVYHNMLTRCGYKENTNATILYLCVDVCSRWLGNDGFVNFVKDMGEMPGPKYSIDRIDPDGPYSPENCQWLPLIQNKRKQRGPL